MYAVDIAYTVDIVYTADIVYTVDMVYTVDRWLRWLRGLTGLMWLPYKCIVRWLGHHGNRLYRFMKLRSKKSEWVIPLRLL